MNEILKIDVLINFKEYLKCNFLIVRKKLLQIFASLAIISISCIFVALLKLGLNFDVLKIILIIHAVVMIFIVIFFMFLYLNMKKQFESTPILKQKISYKVTEDGVETQGDSFNSKIGWDMFIKAEEFKDYSLLYPSPASVFIFPLRCFESDFQVTQFRELVRRNLNNNSND